MCKDCGCNVVREVEINGTGGQTTANPGPQSTSSDHGLQAHKHPHEPGHPHDHAHAHAHDPTPTLTPTPNPNPNPTHDHDYDHDYDHEHEHETPHRTVTVNESVIEDNDRQAERNRGYFRAKNLLVLNVLSSPGSGKTTFLQKTVMALGPRLRAGVIVGDLATDNDATRLRQTGAPVVQITTGTVCHLDASMVARAVNQLDLETLDLLFIENVGNLVCPAAYDLGENLRVALLSVTEGEDKPLKYPPLFHSAQVAVVSKIDLAAAAEFARDTALANLRRISPQVRIFEMSARTGEGLPAWIDYLAQQHQSLGKSII